MIYILIIIFLIIILGLLFYFYFKEYEFFTDLIPVPTYNPSSFDIYNQINNPFPTSSPLYMDYLLLNSQLLIPSTNELSKNPQISIPTPSLYPILDIKSQTSLLTQLKEENNKIKSDNLEQQVKLEELNKQLIAIYNEIQKKEIEKLKLSEQISNLDNNKIVNNSIINLVIKAIDANLNKEKELNDLKNEIENKKEKLEKLLLEPIAPVIIKEEQINPLMDKLKELEKKFTDMDNKIPNNICTLNNSMPEPQKEAFIFDLNQVQNPSYLWCMCNDNNKNSSNCLDYMECNKNYLNNKDKTALINDDLTLYMKCLTKYPNFPHYLTDNNKK